MFIRVGSQSSTTDLPVSVPDPISHHLLAPSACVSVTKPNKLSAHDSSEFVIVIHLKDEL